MGLFDSYYVHWHLSGTADSGIRFRIEREEYPRHQWFKKVSKSWRWYDRFRTWAEYPLHSLPCLIPVVRRTVQERLSTTQRRHQKRRSFIQSLRRQR